MVLIFQGFRLVHKSGDLFSCDESQSLAHCVSRDLRMGKGIAVMFKKIFASVNELKVQGKKSKEYLNRNARQRTSEHVRPAKTQIRLRMRAV